MQLAMMQLETLMLLPYMWLSKLQQAHHEFMDDLFADMHMVLRR